MKPARHFWTFIPLACLISLPAWSQKSLEVRRTQSAARFFLDVGFSRLSNQEDVAINAITGAVGALYGVSSQVGIFGQIQQAFSSSGFNSAYSLLEVGASYALMGQIKGSNTQIVLDGTPVVSSRDGADAAVRVSLFADQFLINTSTRVLGLAGFGLSLHYDHPLSDRLGLMGSLRWARASNGAYTITPMQASVGLTF